MSNPSSGALNQNIDGEKGPVEPIIHSHITDLLDDDHPLAFRQVHCELCGELVHAANNECMQSWVEFAGHIICLIDFAKYLTSGDEYRAAVLTPHEFVEWLEEEVDNAKA